MRKIVTVLFGFLLLLGCQTANKPPANEAAPTPARRTAPKVQQTAPEPRQTLSAQEKADRLANLATQVPNVRDATAVVAGKVAFIGIDVGAELDRSRVGTIKYTVAQAVKKDPHGANVLVTADADIVQRLREINADIRRGRPVSGFMDELAALTGRLAPQPSRGVEKKEQPPSKTEQQRINQTPNPQKPRQKAPKQR